MKTVIAKFHELASRLSTEPGPDYKDEWERGYDAGQMAAGRELLKIIAEATQ